MQGYIHDGYTIQGFIRGTPRLFPDLRFEYRPMMLNARARTTGEISKRNQAEQFEQAELICSRAIVAQLISWDLTDHDGKPVELTVENVHRLQPKLHERLFFIIIGNSAPDIDPNETDIASQDFLERALSGKEPVTVVEELGGNSQAG